MNKLRIKHAKNVTINLENVSINQKLYFIMEYSSNVKILGIPDCNKIYFIAYDCNEIITDSQIECQVISIKSKIKLSSRKYILNCIYTAIDLESLGENVIKKISLGLLDLHHLSENFTKRIKSEYKPEPNEDNYLDSSCPLYNSLYFSNLKLHNITCISNIKKNH